MLNDYDVDGALLRLIGIPDRLVFKFVSGSDDYCVREYPKAIQSIHLNWTIYTGSSHRKFSPTNSANDCREVLARIVDKKDRDAVLAELMPTLQEVTPWNILVAQPRKIAEAIYRALCEQKVEK